MPSFGDSIFIFILALILFGPKKLPEIARWMGKLMAEFRRASNEFRIQMEDELRMAEQAETQKKFAAQSATETLPAETSVPENSIAADVTASTSDPLAPIAPIATSGEITMRLPETGLPVSAESTVPELPAESLDTSENNRATLESTSHD
jgi:sec-independent protein translocase protein TatB